MKTKTYRKRRVDIGLSEEAECALALLPKSDTETKAWWLNLIVEEGLLAMADHLSAGGPVCLPRFEVSIGKDRRAMRWRAELEEIADLLKRLETNPAP